MAAARLRLRNPGPSAYVVLGLALLTAAVLALIEQAAGTDGPVERSPKAVLVAWRPNAAVVLALLGGSWMYGRGTRLIWSRRGGRRLVGHRHVACFTAAVVATAVALISPLDAMAETLFSAHMVQHMVLAVAAAPLLASSRLDVVLTAALPRKWRRRLGPVRRSGLLRAVTPPAVAWWAFALVFWCWHAPWLFQAAVDQPALHALEHAALLVTAILFWDVALNRAGRTLPYPLAILFVFTAMLQMSVLASLLTFSGSAWYAGYAESTLAWGMDPVTDQQLGGLLMWTVSSALFLGVIGLLIVRWFALEEGPTTKLSEISTGYQRLPLTTGRLSRDDEALPPEPPERVG